MDKYTPDQVEMMANLCRSDTDRYAQDREVMLRAFAATLRQQAARVDVDDAMVMRAMVAQNTQAHDLYKTGDADAPSVIKDRNGEVVLGLCRRCGQAEADLADTCPAQNTQVEAPVVWVDPADLQEDHADIMACTDAMHHLSSNLRYTTPLYLHAERARVPEITREMWEAGTHAYANWVAHVYQQRNPTDEDRQRAYEISRDAMLAAAPSQPEDAA